MPESAKKSFVIFTYFVLTLSTLLVFWQVHNFDFINHDDNFYVYENPHVLNGLSPDGIIWAFTTPNIGNWLPLTWLSFMLDCQLFGANPGQMHLMNLILHLANTLLLFAVLKKMTGALWPCAFVAAAFAIHPMHIESVVWITERKDVLSTFFLLLTLTSYIGYVKHRGMGRYVLTLFLFALGLLAKPMIVTLPILLLLLDYWPLERTGGARTEDRERQTEGVFQMLSTGKLIIEKVPFFILSVVSSIITFLVQFEGYGVISLTSFPLKARVFNAFLSYAKYTGKMFWPQNLAIFHPFDPDSFALWRVAMCVILLLFISIFVIRFGRNQKYLPVGWFWFVLTLVPVIGLVQSGLQSYADRYTYIPYIGLFIMIAWGLPEFLSKWPQRKITLGLSMVIVLIILGIYAHKQVGFWKNNITLFSHAVEVTQNNYLAYNNLGAAYDSSGRYQDAIEAYKRSLKIKPDYEVYLNLGIAYGKLGRREEEVEAYKQSLKIKPDYTMAYINLGVAYNSAGRYQDAIEMYKQGIKINPNDADAYYKLSFTYAKLGRWQDAVETCKQVIKIKPDDVGAHFNLGLAYLASGDKESAFEECKILKTMDAEKANELFKLINK